MKNHFYTNEHFNCKKDAAQGVYPTSQQHTFRDLFCDRLRVQCAVYKVVHRETAAIRVRDLFGEGTAPPVV